MQNSQIVKSAGAEENENIKIETPNITEVTVFLDRAMVTRTANSNLTKGEHVIIFDNLPESIETNSLQATGKGKAILRDVRFKQTNYPEVTDDKILELNKKILNTDDNIVDANDIIVNAKKEKQITEELIAKIITRIEEKPTKNEVRMALDMEKLFLMIDTYRSKLNTLDKEIRSTERKIRKYEDELDFLNSEINNSGSKQERSKYFAEVLIDVQEESTIEINLTYMVYGPAWYPVYDLRVSGDSKKMDLIYYANIMQNTLEDWENVQIKLSTARANVGGHQPDLSPWYLSLYEENVLRERVSSESKKMGMSQMYNEMPSKSLAVEDEEVFEPGAPDISISAAGVEMGATAAVFAVAGKNTINSDNQHHKVTIMMQSFDASFRYSTVPKLAPYAYLKAKVKNTSDFPILAGSTNVFLDNNFVATSQIEQVNPDQEFWTFLGVDDGIKVEYKTIKNYQKDDGIISKKSKFINEYIIEITSNKKNQEEIVIWDQIPISNHEDIKINLIEPKLSDNQKNVKINDYNYIEWFFNIKPGEKIKIPFKFTVESPKNKNISGI